MFKPQIIEDEIGRKLKEADQSGELRSARDYGKPLSANVEWEQTPDALRMPFKILKDAGVVPAEVEMFKARATLRQRLNDATDPAEVRMLQRKISVLEQSIALRLEALRRQT